MSHDTTLIKKRNNINLSILLVGQLMSIISTFMFDFGIALYVLDKGNTETQYSIIVAIGMIGRIIISLFAGAYIDRKNKKKIIVIADLLSCVAVLVGTLLLLNDSFGVVNICIVVFILNCLNSLFLLAFLAAVPNLFEGEKEVMIGNSILQSVQAIAAIVGPILGSILYSNFGLKPIIIINLLSFFLTGILEMFLKYKANKTTEQSNYFKEVKEGFSYINNKTNLKRLCTFYILFQTIVQPLLTLLLNVIAYKHLHISGFQLGIVQAGYAIGVLIGASLASAKKEVNTILNKFWTWITVEGILVILWFILNINAITKLGHVGETIIFTILVTLFSIINMYLTVPLIGYFQMNIKESMRGRLFGIITTALTVGGPIGSIVYGVLIKKVDWYIIVVIAGVLIIGLSFIYKNKIKFNSDN